MIIWLTACSQPGSVSGSNQAAAARRMLIDQLSRSLDSSVFRVRIDTSRIKWRSDTSSVVPKLSYVWAWYYPAGVSHGVVSSVLANRAGNLRIVNTAADWSSVAEGWFPKNAEQAKKACAELARVAGQKGNRGRLAVPIAEARREIAAMPADLRQQAPPAQADSPLVQSPSGPNRTWKVTEWMFETGRTTRYECTFREGDGSAALDTLSIIRGVGWDLLQSLPSDTG